MKRISPFILLLVVTIILAGCSKEKRISRSLYKNDGQWQLDSYIVKSSEDGVHVGTINFIALGATGTLVFDNSNEVSSTITVFGNTTTDVGTWSNSSDKLSFKIDGSLKVFDIEDRTRKSFDIKAIENYVKDGTMHQDIIEITLSR